MNTKDMICVTSRSFSNNTVLKEELISVYKNVKFNTTGKSLQGADLKNFLLVGTKAIIALEPIDENLLSNLPDLKVISKFGVGLDSIDKQALKRHNVRLGWEPGVNKRSVAELVISFAISLVHRIPEALEVVNNGLWTQVIGNLLENKTIGIIGCGNIGQELIHLLKPFGCRILINDILDLTDVCLELNITQVSLDKLLMESDIISIHVPYDETTKMLLNKEKLKKVKLGAGIINLSRGGIIDENQLDKCVRDGNISGAFLDVLNDEPFISSRLASNPKIIITPHIGGSSEEAILAMGRAAIRGLEVNHYVE